MDEVTLTWGGPFRVPALLSDPALRAQYARPGIYLWVVTIRGPYFGRISYIGKAEGGPNLVQRQQEHFTDSIGCVNSIPAWARACGVPWACFFEKPEIASVLFSKPRLLDVVSEAFDYVTSFDVYLAPYEGVLLSTVEKNLIWDLKPLENSKGVKNAPDTRLVIRHSNARWLDASTAG